MELKEVIWRVGNNQLRRFNRTIMELKDASSAWKGAKVEGFNRTFMELKGRGPPCMMIAAWFQSHLYGIESVALCAPFCWCSVSIAPLWNWKRWWAWWTSASTRFNRTFMELKVGSSFFAHTATFRFNRTFMELKDTFRLWTRNKHQCFNRTFMELKVEYIGGVQRRREFQSHLYGIERS